MTRHSDIKLAYDNAAQHLREVIDACHVGPNSPGEKDRMSDAIANALAALGHYGRRGSTRRVPALDTARLSGFLHIQLFDWTR